MTERLVWLVRSESGSHIELCTGRRKPYLNGVRADMDYDTIRALGITGLKPGCVHRVRIYSTTYYAE